MRGIVAAASAVCVLVAAILTGAPPARAAAAVVAATCADSEGPGIAHPATVESGKPGFHAAWYGQSGYPRLCPGHRSTATVAFYNNGSFGWLQNAMGQVAYLGTWSPEPGQDRVSPLGGDGTNGSPNTGWPRYNRIAMQPALWVGPTQVAWFQFTIQAPMTPGYYRLYLRPLIEGATWLEDYGVFWQVTVLNPDGSLPPQPAAVYTPVGYSTESVTTSAGTFTVKLVKEPLAQVSVRTLTANSTDCSNSCPAKPLDQYVTSESGGFAGMHGSYFCPPDYAACATMVNTYSYAVYNSDLRRWLTSGALTNPYNSLASWNSGTPTFYQHVAQYGQSGSPPVTAAISNYPLLLQGGSLIDSSSLLSSGQLVRGTRGAIGVDGTYVYLAIVYPATVPETAGVLQMIGVRDALNLDGGGSAALWIDGGYVVGPGRLLPNAIVLTRP
ncbi:MAG TPA: phosphodiester glycosidase family protein [Candidatus Limnocylindria bacterium]